ncbi:hypothetical protein BDF22DRAFT_671142 [Syncephalis plumigaleata]|nr:hypothetical protein BDF22DRAFT_671142 [Syncephalis plumigaleata]
MAAPSTPSTPSTPLPKIRLKIGKLSIGLPQTSPSTSTSTSVSSLSKPSIPTVTAAPLLDTNVMTSNEPEEIINCICDAPTIDHGRFMIACDQCATWFHGECVHVGPDTVPDGTEWYCPRCSTTKQS